MFVTITSLAPVAPFTASLYCGLVVPIPTLPFGLILIRSVVIVLLSGVVLKARIPGELDALNTPPAHTDICAAVTAPLPLCPLMRQNPNRSGLWLACGDTLVPRAEV